MELHRRFETVEVVWEIQPFVVGFPVADVEFTQTVELLFNPSVH